MQMYGIVLNAKVVLSTTILSYYALVSFQQSQFNNSHLYSNCDLLIADK